MKVLIIAALVLVAQCQLQPAPRPGHEAHEGHRTEEGRVDIQKGGTLPRLPEEMAQMNLRQFEYYTTAKSEAEKEGRQEDTREAVFIVFVRNEAYDQLIPKGQEDPLKDKKNNEFLVNLMLGLMSADSVNLEDANLIRQEGLDINTMKEGRILKLKKDARSGVFTLNDIKSERKEIPGKDQVVLLILEDFLPEDKEGITRLTHEQGGRTEEKRPDEHVIGQPGQQDPGHQVPGQRN